MSKPRLAVTVVELEWVVLVQLNGSSEHIL